MTAQDIGWIVLISFAGGTTICAVDIIRRRDAGEAVIMGAGLAMVGLVALGVWLVAA